MKLLIAADMEGITGVVDWNHVSPGHPEYQRFRAMQTQDINAAIQGALSAGVDEIVVTDGHGPKTNILIEKLDSHARLNSGTGPLSMVQGVDQGVDAAFFIGYHARSGTPDAILCHTVSSQVILNLWLNDRLTGEIGMNAAVCGFFKVPILLLSGDQAACTEARTTISGIETVITKKASGQKAAECLPAEVTHACIRAAAEKAVRQFQKGVGPAPLVTSTPVRFTIEFFNPSMADHASELPGTKRLDGRRVEVGAETPPLAYQYFRSAMKLASG
jgi:D-amino peptidase